MMELAGSNDCVSIGTNGEIYLVWLAFWTPGKRGPMNSFLLVRPSICTYVVFVGMWSLVFLWISHSNREVDIEKSDKWKNISGKILQFLWSFVVTFAGSNLKWKKLTVFCFPLCQSHIWLDDGKLGMEKFISYIPKYSQPIWFQDSFIINTCGREAWISLIFLHGDIYQEKVASLTATLA